MAESEGAVPGKWTARAVRALSAISLGVAIYAAMKLSTPHPLPGVALGSSWIWKIEVGGVVLLAGLVVSVVVVRGVIGGQLPSKLGTGGAEYPDAIAKSSDVASRALEEALELRKGLDAIAAVVGELSRAADESGVMRATGTAATRVGEFDVSDFELGTAKLQTFYDQEVPALRKAVSRLPTGGAALPESRSGTS